MINFRISSIINLKILKLIIAMKKIILTLTIGLILSLNGMSQRTLHITSAKDSLSMWDSLNWCPVSPPKTVNFYVKVKGTGYAPKDTLNFQIFYGDGTYQTKPVHYSYLDTAGMFFSHSYLKNGSFDVTYIVSDLYGDTDKVVNPAEVLITQDCSNLTVNVFIDKNSNCIYDGSDEMIYVPYTLYRGAYYIYKGYAYSIPNHQNYTIIIDTAAIRKAGYVLTCPASPVINFTANGSNTFNFAVNCTTKYDMSVTSSGNPFKVGNSVMISVGVNAGTSCYSKSGTYTLNLDPRMSFVYALYPPASGSGQTYSWNYSNLGGIGNGNTSVSNLMYCNLDRSVKLGDSVCYSFSVLPKIGDIDTLNNKVKLCYKVKSAWDPNYIDVAPLGIGAQGIIFANTQLTYTIGFQNTGNASASHVYILDTLDNNLDLNSFQIIYSNYPVHLYIIDGKILKFDFVNINLPDSGSNRFLSHGFISYKINQKPNLPIGTQIKNKAAIFFDYNPAVITNQTLNTIGKYMSVNELSTINYQLFTIYPNPASNLITINISPNPNLSHSSCLISIKNLQGQDVLKQHTEHSAQSTINVSGLSNGIYFITIQNEKLNYVNKIVISH